MKAVQALSLILVLFACEQQRPATGPVYRQRSTARVVTPEGGSNVTFPASVSTIPDAIEEPLATKVPMNREDNVLQVINVNLDIDQLDEQIIVFKNTLDPSDRIRVMVADFDDIRNSYTVAWQGETQANNIRSISIQMLDLIGDHTIEIACLGQNNAGEQTMDVFRRAPSPQGFGLYYESIFSIATPGTIEIEERERSSAYQLMQRTEESFPIVVYTRDPESDNVLDVLRTTYHWHFRENRYVRGRTEKIAGQRIEEQQLAELHRGGAAGMESFLAGPWYRARGTAGTDILHFDPASRRIVFYSDDVQEIIDWTNSYRTFRGLFINGVNEFIHSITKQISVSVQSMDTIEVQVRGGEGWDGSYRKLSREMQASMLEDSRERVRMWTVELSGLYRNEAGLEIFFSPPAVTIRENGVERRGGFVVYQHDGDILEMKLLKPNGLVDSVKSYRIAIQEDEREQQVIRTLTLDPVQVTYRGVEALRAESLRLRQVVDRPTSRQ